jgi:hypothetical protein
MAVYVDDYQVDATVGRLRRNWSHLTADTTEELMEFAAKLGMKLSWIQYPGTWKEHFDVTNTVRVKALKMGAISIGYGSPEAINFFNVKRKAMGMPLVALRKQEEERIPSVAPQPTLDGLGEF